MELRRFIGSGIAASAVAHLSVLTVVLIFAEVHPFGSVTTEMIAVDIVSPEEVTQSPKEEEPLPTPKAQSSDALDLSAKSADSSSPAPAARQQAAQPQPPSTSAAIAPPEPDLSIKYHVLLGLPPDLPQDRPGDGFDAAASTTTGVASSLVTEFRRHLKTCLKLPESITPSDTIKIKLRVLMTPDGKLATEPVLIEASASVKGPVLMQSAISALRACQPYAMLPADKYGEWKVLDLNFTPQDFAGG